MTTTLVDSNVLLDILTEDPAWFDWSSDALETAADIGRLVINPVIYSEVSVRFTTIEELEEVVPRSIFEREALPFEAAFLAGKAFVTYRKRGGVKLSPLPDFFVGAHAAVAGYRLLTRDASRFRAYFNGLNLIAPS